ncbi:MAG: MATE family efflux transporter [Bacteroidales bacterium]|nr:MATE family efflux transporter [Bacteroidales bacterium]
MKHPATLDDKQHYMTHTPVWRLVLRMAVPSILSMLVTATYNVVDAVFIGRLSTEATAGIGISFAYMTFIQAVGFFFGHGSGNYISHQLGGRHYGRAVRMASLGFACPMAIGTVAAVLGLLFLAPLVRLLGATPTVEPYACDYLRYIVMATPVMMTAFTLNNQLRLQGNAHLGTLGIASGALLNMALDPLFIFVLDMGVAGASLATAVSQLTSWAILLCLTHRKDCVHIDLRQARPSSFLIKEIVRCGLPSLCRQVLLCLGAVCLNYSAVHYAEQGSEDAALAAFSVVTRIMMFAFSVVLGLCQGFQPVCGFNYGARRYDRVRQAYLFTISVGTLFLIIIGTVGYVWAPTVVAWFRGEDSTLIAIGARTMRWQCIAYPLVGLSTATNMLFQNLGYTLRASLLSSARSGLVLIPVLWLTGLMMGLPGVEAAQAIADVITFGIALPQAIWISHRLSRTTATGE